jgi:hypothetical protein
MFQEESGEGLRIKSRRESGSESYAAPCVCAHTHAHTHARTHALTCM